MREIRIEKASDTDLLREMLQFVAGKLMELEVDGRPHSRTPSTFMSFLITRALRACYPCASHAAARP